jgi:hypothetical protein
MFEKIHTTTRQHVINVCHFNKPKTNRSSHITLLFLMNPSLRRNAKNDGISIYSSKLPQSPAPLSIASPRRDGKGGTLGRLKPLGQGGIFPGGMHSAVQASWPIGNISRAGAGSGLRGNRNLQNA